MTDEPASITTHAGPFHLRRWDIQLEGVCSSVDGPERYCDFCSRPILVHPRPHKAGCPVGEARRRAEREARAEVIPEPPMPTLWGLSKT